MRDGSVHQPDGNGLCHWHVLAVLAALCLLGPLGAAAAAHTAPEAADTLSNRETVAFLAVLALFPLSVLAIRWLTQRHIQHLMNVDADESPQPPAFRRHDPQAELRAAVQPRFELHDAGHVNADAAAVREGFVARSLGLFRRAVLLDVAAGLAYVLLLALLGASARPSDDTDGLTAALVVVGLLYPALAGVRYGIYRDQFRPRGAGLAARWLGWVPVVRLARALIGPRFQAWLAGLWAALMLLTGIGVALDDTEGALHRTVGALLAVAAVLHVLLAGRALRRLQRESGVRLLVLRVFGIDANASFTFGRVLAFWQHFGNHFTVLDPSIWRHRFPLMSWRTGLFMLAVGAVGFVALGTVLQRQAWEPHAFTITAVVLALLLGVYAALTRLLLKREFVRSRAQLVAVLDRLEQRPRHLDLSFRRLEAMCHNDTWQIAVDEFAARSQALLMDLRGFSKERKGCQTEVDYLLDTVPLEQVLFLVDAGGDHGLVRQMILERWEFLSPDSPNLHERAPVVHIYVAGTTRASDEADVQGILDLLMRAAQAGSRRRAAAPPLALAA